MKFKILSLEKDNELRSLIDQCITNDIHCHPDYLHLFSEYLSAEGVYAFFGDKNNYILTPFLKQKLPCHEKDAQYFDLISPWYYGGPIYYANPDINLENLKYWRRDFDKYCQENNIVSEIQRLNPIIDNQFLFDDDIRLSYNRNIVFIDLKKELNQIYDEYAHKARKNIKKAERSGLKIICSNSKDDFEKFITVYLLSMKEKKANQFYHFNEKFFSKFFTIFPKNLQIFRVEYDGKTIAATVVLGKYGILHDYLRGSLKEYLSLRPNDFMIDEIIKYAKENGYNYYSLGGGSSINPDDPIFNFKKSFSSTTKKFYTYKKIHNLEKYKELCSFSGLNTKELVYEQASFFPEYSKPQTNNSISTHKK